MEFQKSTEVYPIIEYVDDCDLKDPTGLSVDNNDILFLCELFKGSVKKRKYLK